MKQIKTDMHYCNLPKVRERVFDKSVSIFREQLIRVSQKKWISGTTLNFYFFQNDTDGKWVHYTDGTKEWKSWKGSKEAQEVVRDAFKQWKDVGIGLNFKEVIDKNDSHIRIGFMQGDGSWSYLGRDVLAQGINQRTMNFGWDIIDDVDTALHEIGHTLGFPHEHQNPKAGIEWDEEKVYESLSDAPNFWKRDTTYQNIIRKIDADAVQGSNWDPNSIMHYPFKPGLIKKPSEFNVNGLYPNPGLSHRDMEWAREFYPKVINDNIKELKPAVSSILSNEEFGKQDDFSFKPDSTRKFNVKVVGEQDGVMVLFKKSQKGELIYLSGDDDSGEEKNAEIEHKLIKGEEYIISYRQFYNSGKESAIIIY